jgi:NAD-dependent SIR2 family protein deacetylase
MSADSGLAVYNQIADVPAYHKMNLTYADLCVPNWFLKDKEIYYGFWGKCFNDYREKPPHKGYKILYELIQEYFSNISQIDLQIQIAKTEERKKELQSLDPKPRYFIYTSNVDSHFIDFGFPKERVDEIHGSCSQWFCHNGCPNDKSDIWDLPVSFRFNIDLNTMRLNNGQNYPKCAHCKGAARPHVLMFNDYEWIGQRRTGYSKWKKRSFRKLSKSGCTGSGLWEKSAHREE